MLLGVLRHPLLSLLAAQAAKLARVDEQAVFVSERQHRLIHLAFRGWFAFAPRQDDYPDLETVFLSELVIALVVCRHAHDGAGAVLHHNVVGDPNGNFLAIEGIHREAAGVDAVLLDGADIAGLARLTLLGKQLIHLADKLGIAGA